MSATVTARFATGHVGLNVSDVERAKRFYTGVVDRQVLGEGADPVRRFALLGDGERIVLTLWQQSTGRFPADRPGLHHLAFEVESIEQVRAAEARARALGARSIYDGIVPHAEGARSGGVFFEDPDGIRLEIHAPSGAGRRRRAGRARDRGDQVGDPRRCSGVPRRTASPRRRVDRS